jgi:hypothetical protein
MFYRVDYALAVLFAGFIGGVSFSRRTAAILPSRLARGYYVAVAILLVVRTAVFACTLLTTDQGFCGIAVGFTGDFAGFLFGALFGLAARRTDARKFLVDPSVLDALCMAIAFTFSMAAVGKAFSLAPMTEFFTQSGYSVAFLKFVVIAEIFGAVGLLLPWAIVPSLIGLTTDMFGAVVTHIHNGDPLNDSTGAIGLLIRHVAVGILWALRPRSGKSERTVRNSLFGVGAIAIACLLFAIAGSVAVRHLSPPVPAIASPSSP